MTKLAALSPSDSVRDWLQIRGALDHFLHIEALSEFVPLMREHAAGKVYGT
jgi:hypothetical protein